MHDKKRRGKGEKIGQREKQTNKQKREKKSTNILKMFARKKIILTIAVLLRQTNV